MNESGYASSDNGAFICGANGRDHQYCSVCGCFILNMENSSSLVCCAIPLPEHVMVLLCFLTQSLYVLFFRQMNGV